MIFVNGKMTSWRDNGVNMIKAAQEVATSGSRNTITSDTGGRINTVGRDGYTEDTFLIEAAQRLGLAVYKTRDLGMEIKLI